MNLAHVAHVAHVARVARIAAVLACAPCAAAAQQARFDTSLVHTFTVAALVNAARIGDSLAGFRSSNPAMHQRHLFNANVVAVRHRLRAGNFGRPCAFDFPLR